MEPLWGIVIHFVIHPGISSWGACKEGAPPAGGVVATQARRGAAHALGKYSAPPPRATWAPTRPRSLAYTGCSTAASQPRRSYIVLLAVCVSVGHSFSVYKFTLPPHEATLVSVLGSNPVRQCSACVRVCMPPSCLHTRVDTRASTVCVRLSNNTSHFKQ